MYVCACVQSSGGYPQLRGQADEGEGLCFEVFDVGPPACQLIPSDTAHVVWMFLSFCIMD